MVAESDILLPQGPGASGWRPPSEQEITLARSNLDLPPPAQEVAVLPSIDDEAVARARANLGEPPQTVAMPMETAPQQQQSVLGPEADVSVDALGQIRGSIQDQAADRIRAMIAGQVVSSPNAMYGPTKQYIGAEKETDTRLRGALDQQGQVEQLRMQEEATAYASEAARMQARNDAAEQIEMQRRERMIEQEKVMQDASKQYADAVTKFASAPPVDPDRYWASKSAGFKFIARLASGLNALGGAGPAEAMAHITNAIREDIDAQKANRGALGEQAQLTGTQYSQATSTYNQLLSTLQDERMADTVMENARLEEARAQLDRIVAGYAPKSKDAQHQALLAEIDKQQAQNNLRLAQLSANNPRVISRRVSNMSPLELKLQEKVLDSEIKQTEGVTGDIGKIITEGAKGPSIENKLQAKRLDFDADKETRARAQAFGKQVEPVISTITMVKKLKDHLATGGWATGDRTTRDLRRLTNEALGRTQSQGAITDEELVNFNEMTSAVFAERNIKKLDLLEEMLNAKIENARRSNGDDAAALYFRASEDRMPTLGGSSIMSSASGAKDVDSLVSSER